MANEKEQKPIGDTKNKKINQIGIVVEDAPKTAKKYSEIFGIGPWMFIDLASDDMIFRNRKIGDGTSMLRAAMANLGRIQIELIQPLCGEGTHADFLKKRGEGIHHVSFGIMDDYDNFLSALTKQGIQLEMSGAVGGDGRFAYIDTIEDLGTIYEFVRAPTGDLQSLKPWGTYQPQGPGLINTKGKEILQLGIVVEDAEKTAKNYWDLFGMGPWNLIDFKKPHLSEGALHGVVMSDDTDFHIRAATADFGDMEIELLEPVTGPSPHMEFLKSFGQGIHHVSFRQSEDHDEVVSIMQSNEIDIEMKGILGGAIRFTYMDTQKELGTIYEIAKIDPNVEMTLAPYGTYPPSL